MKKKIVFIVNHAAFFVSHRIKIAIEAKKKGHEVFLLIGQASSKTMEFHAEKELINSGIRFKRILFNSSKSRIFLDFFGFFQLLKHIYFFRPDIVHLVSPIAIIHGGIAARILKIKSIVVAISGMGTLFTGEIKGLKKILGKIFMSCLKYILNHPSKKIIVQNTEDFNEFKKMFNLSQADLLLFYGSGVDLKLFEKVSIKEADPIVLFPSRILENKGVNEFVESARILKKKYSNWKFVIVGADDYNNPSAISKKNILKWIDEGVIEWWGYSNNMSSVFAKSSIVCLPSHREGMPKCLLEAAAVGRPVVTTDIAGCREAIVPNKTGQIIPTRNSTKLTEALELLISDESLRENYSMAARNLAVEKFDEKKIINSTLKIYESFV